MYDIYFIEMCSFNVIIEDYRVGQTLFFLIWQHLGVQVFLLFVR